MFYHVRPDLSPELANKHGVEFHHLPNKVKKSYKRGTICGVYNEEEGKLAISMSACSHKDAFVKAVGRNLALKRVNSMKLNEPSEYIYTVSKEEAPKKFIEVVKQLEREFNHGISKPKIQKQR